jgi:hypothetical protein
MGCSVSEASFPESPLRTRPICPLRGCESQTGPTQDKTSLNIVSLGNDPRRDWKLLIEVVRGRQDWSLKIASQKVERSALSNSSNVEIGGWKTNDEWLALHRWTWWNSPLSRTFMPRASPLFRKRLSGAYPSFVLTPEAFGHIFRTQQSEAAPREAIGAFADKRDVRLSFARSTQDSHGPAWPELRVFCAQTSRAIARPALP